VIQSALTLKSRLPRTWSPFFAQHGAFTAAQLAAIPPLLDGHNVILCAPTASGKTEAALAPLVERHLPPEHRAQELTILYLLPTRALINDIAHRLATPLERLRVQMAVKTRDLDTLRPDHPADLLLTTPESLDALLATKPKTLSSVRAVVIDELHVLDGSVRGDQLRAVLSRLRGVRAHAGRSGDAPDAQLQYVALSATLAEPAQVAARYFPTAQVVGVSGSRDTEIEMLAMNGTAGDTHGGTAVNSAAALIAYLATFHGRSWRKALVFCNTRAEVEAYAMAVRAAHTPFGHAVYVHYSNLERARRQEIEQQFAQAGAAICFASSTLELGIDIGSIDVAILIGAPGSVAAFVQRIGRAGRRRQTIRAACFYRSPLEEALLAALAAAPEAAPTATPFRPSVAVQQIFSLLLQSPTGAVRLQPLVELFNGLLTAADLEAILGHLHDRDYLITARNGEWRAGKRLNHLVDLQASEHAPLSLYSNIQNRAAKLKIRDQHSQQVVATVDSLWLEREVLTLEGRQLDVSWYDGEALWVTARRDGVSSPRLPYLSSRQLLSFALAQRLPGQLGISPGVAPLVETPAGWLLFHWLGDVYGQALLDLLQPTLPVEESTQPGLCMLLHDEPRGLPSISLKHAERYLRDHAHQYEGLLALGAYQHLLPRNLRRQAVVEQFDVGCFVETVATLRLERTAESAAEALVGLIGKDARA
jgi:ATP-dependent helicase Lhr and Lhr-like helicase